MRAKATSLAWTPSASSGIMVRFVRYWRELLPYAIPSPRPPYPGKPRKGERILRTTCVALHAMPLLPINKPRAVESACPSSLG